jgi:cytochrome c oxidase subunit IV
MKISKSYKEKVLIGNKLLRGNKKIEGPLHISQALSLFISLSLLLSYFIPKFSLVFLFLGAALGVIDVVFTSMALIRFRKVYSIYKQEHISDSNED